MNTLLDVQNKLYELYAAAREKYPFDEEEEWEAFNIYDEDMEEPPEVNDRLVYIYNEILRENDDDLICLVAVYYLTFLMQDISNMEIVSELCNIESDYYDDIMDSMKNDSKEEFLNKIRNPILDEDYLMDMLSVMMYHDFLEFDEDTEIEYREDYDEWEDLEKALTNSSIFKDIFEKFHPNIKAEEKEYKKYKTQCYNVERLLKLVPKSTEEFITIFMQAKKLLITNDCAMFFLEDWLDKIKEQNPELLKRIMIIILRYYFVEEYVKAPYLGYEAEDKIAECIEYITDLPYYADIIDEFVNFDIVEFSKDIAKVPKSDLNVFEDLINIENTKTYGTSGTWKKYPEKNQHHFDHISDFEKRAYSWTDILGSVVHNPDKKQYAYAYFTKDKDGNMTIPRILFIYNYETNELSEVLGRDENGNLELELVDILEDKLKELDLLKGNELVINNLKYLNLISTKVKANIPLDNEEIDFLYEITKKHQIDFDCNINRHHFRPTYLTDLGKKSGDKKNLAKYFNCTEDQVVLPDKDGDYNYNQNMVVTTSLWHSGTTCKYPKLKAILGCLMATTLNDANSLDNLEVIGGDVFCESLKSSRHLEKLTRIGGLADFSGMTDVTHFNSNLVIERHARFKDGNEPKNIKILNKD